MSYKKLFFFIAVALITSLFACSDNEVENININYGYEYFPLVVGKNKVYQVDSLTFDTLAGKKVLDSVRFYLMESTVESFVNAKGDSVFRIERYTRASDKQAWVLKDVVSSEKNNNLAFRTEQNFRILKLAFPLNVRSQWKPTQFIDEEVEITAGNESIKMFKNWSGEVKDIDKEATILGKKFANTSTVLQANSENALELRRVTEKYAKGIGLISSEMEILDTQSISPGTPWRKKAQQGFILKQYLISY